MRKKILLFIILIAVSASVFAAEAFYIKNYNIEIDIAENRVYTISEDLDMYYTEARRGFYRDIPYRYGRIKSNIKVLSSSERYSTEREGDYYSLKFGDEDITIRGDKNYKFSYSYDLGRDQYSDYDEFYYNIIGNWDNTIDNISFKITFPKAIDPEKIWFTSGDYGSVWGEDVEYTLSSDNRTITGIVKHLDEHQSLTLRTEMEEGYFVGARVKKNYQIVTLIVQLVLSIGLCAIVYLLYKMYGVDKDLYVVPRFEAPEGLTPMDAGYIIDEIVDEKDVSAMFFYWADKGYLKIEERDDDEFVFHKVKNLPSFSHPGEIALFDSVFGNNESVTAEDMGERHFPQNIETKVKPAVKRFFKGERAIYGRKSKAMSGTAVFLLIVLAIATTVVLTLNEIGEFSFILLIVSLFGVMGIIGCTAIWRKEQYTKKKSLLTGAIIGTIVSFVILTAAYTFIAFYLGNSFIISIISSLSATVAMVFISYTSIFIEKRSVYGQTQIEQILGYREFLDKVEVDKLKTLIDEDPEYFYHNLSWAMVFGLEDKWAKKFKDLYVQPASWYVSNHFTVSDYLFYSYLTRRWRSAYVRTVVPASLPKNTGGSGSHSGFGGFSGGGFGGGGGRSW